jgi:ketosteroid isomerase-like protein
MKSDYYKPSLLAACAAALMLTACGSPEPGAATNTVGGNAEALREELLQTDYEFSAMAVDQGVEQAYERFLATDAVQLPDGGMPLNGKQDIMANVSASLGDTEFSLSWEPVDAMVSASGDLGYTWGYYYLEATGEDGQPYAAEGKYANIWRHSNAGGWQVLVDMSNQNEPPYLDELELDLLAE